MRVEVAKRGVVDASQPDDASARGKLDTAPAVGSREHETLGTALVDEPHDRRDESREVLTRLGRSDEQDVRAVDGRGARRLREQLVDPVGHHAHPGLGDAEQTGHVARGRMRHAHDPIGEPDRARREPAAVGAAPRREPLRLAHDGEIVDGRDHRQPRSAQRRAERRAVQQVHSRTSRCTAEALAVPRHVLPDGRELLAHAPAPGERAEPDRDDPDIRRNARKRMQQTACGTRAARPALREHDPVERDLHRG